jgi:Predicted acetamidase/formamidase
MSRRTVAMLQSKLFFAVFAVFAFLWIVRAQTPRVHELPLTPEHVHWGYYDARLAPALRVASGDRVRVGTMVAGGLQRWRLAGVPDTDIPQSLKTVEQRVTERGPGAHPMSGPIFVETARPATRSKSGSSRSSSCTTSASTPSARAAACCRTTFRTRDFGCSGGVPERRASSSSPGSRSRSRRSSVDWRGAAPRSWGGSRAAPRGGTAAISTTRTWSPAPSCICPCTCPGRCCRSATATRCRAMARYGHALETSLRGTFELRVLKGQRLRWPRAETPTHYIAMGLHEDLDEATKLAVREMVEFLMAEKKLSRDEAYMLCSLAVDLHVTQAVDATKGVHATLAKALFK